MQVFLAIIGLIIISQEQQAQNFSGRSAGSPHGDRATTAKAQRQPSYVYETNTLSLWNIHRHFGTIEISLPGAKSLIPPRSTLPSSPKAKNQKSFITMQKKSGQLHAMRSTEKPHLPEINELIVYNFERNSFQNPAYAEKTHDVLYTKESAEGIRSALFDGSNRKIVLEPREKFTEKWWGNPKVVLISFWIKPLMTGSQASSQLFAFARENSASASSWAPRNLLDISLLNNRLQIRLSPHLLRSNHKKKRQRTNFGNHQLTNDSYLHPTATATATIDAIDAISPKSISILGGSEISPGQWYYISCVIEPPKDRITTYVNGKQDSQYKHPDGKLRSDTLENASVQLGTSFFGHMDDVRLTIMHKKEQDTLRKWIDNLSGSENGVQEAIQEIVTRNQYPHLPATQETTYPNPQETAWAVSKVWDITRFSKKTELSGKLFTAIKIRHLTQPGSDLKIWFRTADFPFSPHLTRAQLSLDTAQQSGWWLAKDGAPIPTSFRYVQWIARFRSDPDGRTSPRLFDISLLWRPSEIRQLFSPSQLAQTSCKKFRDGAHNKGHAETISARSLCFTAQLPQKFVESQNDIQVHLGLRSGKYPLVFSVQNGDVEATIMRKRIDIRISNYHLQRYLYANRERNFSSLIEEDRVYYAALSLTTGTKMSKLSRQIVLFR